MNNVNAITMGIKMESVILFILRGLRVSDGSCMLLFVNVYTCLRSAP
jgi:hypothetical protein